MNRTMLRISKLLLTVMMLSALIFTGCSCGKKDETKETNKKGVAATIINEDGSVEYVEDIINNGESNAGDEEDVNDIVGSDDGKKSNSGKSDSSKSNSKKSSSKKSNAKKSSSKNSSGSSSNTDSKKSNSKKSDSKKSDSKKSDSKSDDKEKTTKKSNFDIDKTDNDSRFGPIIDGKKKK